MKKLLLIVALFLMSPLSYAQYPATRGMYIDGTQNILGNTTKEDEVIQYLKDSSYTYVALYDLPAVNWNTRSGQLANFISKIHNAGIPQVGGVVETMSTANSIKTYNNSRTSQAEKFNVINLEFEFWTQSYVASGGYYCVQYLRPAGYNCDTAGAFKYYKNLLTQVNQVAHSCGAISEIYLGWFNQGQAAQMAQMVDRIMLHAYRPNPSDVFAYTKTRLGYLASTSTPVTVGIIFSNESVFMMNWLKSNPQLGAWSKYLTDYTADNSAWKTKVTLIGYHWFKWSLFKKPPFPPTTACGTPNVNTFGTSAITPSTARVSWSAVTSATSYQVQYRIRNTGAAYTNAGTTTTTYKDLTGLIPYTNYEFNVTATCVTAGATSAVGWFTTTAGSICGSVTNVINTMTQTSCSINWTGGANNTSYTVRYKKSTASTWTSLTTTATSVSLTGLTASTTYNVEIIGLCTGQQGTTVSSTFTTVSNYTCIVPTGRSSTAIGTTYATLNWSSSIVADSVIARYRKTGTSTWTYRAVVASNGNHAITIINLTSGMTYEWGVATKCGNTVGSFSTSLTFVTSSAAARPMQPDTVAATVATLIYPNPAYDELNINITSASDHEYLISLIDLSGKVVLARTEFIPSGTTTVTLQCVTIARGLYILQVSGGGHSVTEKVILKQSIRSSLPKRKPVKTGRY